MKKSENSVELLVVPLHKFDFKLLSFENNVLILFSETDDIQYHEILDHKTALQKLFDWRNATNVSEVAFISKSDQFNYKTLEKEIKYIFRMKIHSYLTLLIPYLSPPSFSQRNDGNVQSALVSSKLLSNVVLNLNEFCKTLYDLTYTYLNSPISQNIEIIQIGKPKPFAIKTDIQSGQLLKKSLLIVPHKGSAKLLKRCLSHLNTAQHVPYVIVCFDDKSYKKIGDKKFTNLKFRLMSFLNNPQNVGPFLPTHYCIQKSNKEFIFFQGSDDISVNNRFIKQLAELKKRKLDMIGSHELRVDQFTKRLIIFRNPLNVIKPNFVNSFYPLTQGTALITRKSYLKAKGFSTDGHFGYDFQFLLRSCFILKMGNTDDFLYIRFKRPNSLTTKSATKLGSSARSFLSWRWCLDFKLVNENKLDLDDSSLSVQKHQFDYQLIKLRRK